jgi:D-glycero-D-manno-heptose 1,7-bisphosphate phosphatase
MGEYRCDHPWRKPNRGMLLQAFADLQLDPSLCAIVGDKMSDMEAGATAGIGLRVLVGARDSGEGELTHKVAANLGEVIVLLRFHFLSAAER